MKQWSRASGVRKVRGWAAANHRGPAGTTERGPPTLWFTLFGGRWYVEGLPRDCAKKQAGHTLEDVLFLEDIPRVNRDGTDRKVERARDDEHGEGTDEAHLPEHA